MAVRLIPPLLNRRLTARRSVQFFYEQRRDPVMTNAGGAVATSNARLARIQTFITPASSPVLVSDYRLTYGAGPSLRSRLASVTRCDGKGICMPPTKLAWSDGPTGFINSDATLPNINSNQGWEGDFNGDGRTDILSQPNMVNCLTTGTGFTCGNTLNIETGQFNVVADFNGDGRADFFGGGGNQATIYYGTANGLTSNGSTVNTMDLGQPFYVADFDGDGRADLFSQGYISLSTGTGFSSPPLGPFDVDVEQCQTYAADFNGDGMADLFSANCNQGAVYQFTGSSFTQIDVSNLQLCGDNTFLADFNGDSLPDLVSATGGSGYISYGTGHGFTAAASFPNLGTQLGQSWPGDFNGDGRSDIYVQTSGTGGTLYASVAPQKSGVPHFTPIPVQNTVVEQGTSFVGDFNGDGIADFYNIGMSEDDVRVYMKQPWVATASDGGVQAFSFAGQASAATPATTNQLPDLLTSITTGIGGQTSITYKPMTDPSVYTPVPAATSNSTANNALERCSSTSSHRRRCRPRSCRRIRSRSREARRIWSRRTRSRTTPRSTIRRTRTATVTATPPP